MKTLGLTLGALLLAVMTVEAQDQQPDRWQGMLDRMDQDGDGKISKAEFPRAEFFDRLDADGDGFITKEEGAAMMRGRGGQRGMRRRGPGASIALVRAADADKNGDVTTEEWAAFLKTLGAGEDGVVAVDALTKVLPAPRGRRGGGEGAGPGGGRGGEGGDDRPDPRVARLTTELDKDKDGKIEIDDLNAVFAGLDKNRDKKIDASELRDPRMAAFAAQTLAGACDKDKSGDVTTEEWVAFLNGVTVDGKLSVDKFGAALPTRGGGRRGGEGAAAGPPRWMTRVMDHNGDGKLELKDLSAIYAGLDKNKDQALSKDEMPRMRGRRGGERRREGGTGGEGGGDGG